MSVARPNLAHEPTWLALSLTTMALAVALILGGSLRGLTLPATVCLDYAASSIVVTHEGMRNFAGTTALLPPFNGAYAVSYWY